MYYFNYAGELKSQSFHDMLCFLPCLLPTFDVCCRQITTSITMALWTENCELVQALLFLQGEKSAALVGCPTVSGQAKPSTASKNGFHKAKNWQLKTYLAKDTALVALMKSAVRMLNTFSQDLGLGLHQLCCHLLTWCRWGNTGPMVSFYPSPWSNGFFWLIRYKPEIKRKEKNRNQKCF